MLGKIEGKRRGVTEDEMAGWHHWLNGYEFKQTLGDGKGQESLAFCSPWGGKESDTAEQLYNKISAFKEKKASQASFLLEVLKWLSTSAVCKTDPLFGFIN